MAKNHRVQMTGSLQNAFAPTSLKFGMNMIDLGDQKARVYAIVNFPPKAGPAWLAKAASLPGVTLAMHGLPTDALELTNSLNRAISLLSGNLEASHQALTIQRLESQLRDAHALMKKIDQEQQAVFTTGVFLLVTADDETTCLRRSRRVEQTLAAAGMRARVLTHLQEPGLLAAGPWGIFPEKLRGGSPFQIGSETLAAAFPFSSGGINHGKGIVIGNDADSGIVLVDRWDLRPGSPTVTAGVTNRNWTILAASGAGKTHLTKLMVLREWALGAKIIILDPEREYRSLCKQLGGVWVNTTGGGNSINPFQAAPLPADVDEDTDEDEGTTAMTQHVQRLRSFLNLYLPQLTDIQRARLRRGVMAVYKSKGIDAGTDPATVKEWPTMQDLYRYCQDAAAVKDEPDCQEWATLSALLEDAATGIDSRIWAGGKHPDIGNTYFLVLDIHDLQEVEESVQRAQYFNTLGFAWDILRRDRSEKVMLVVDEAWMMVDPRSPEALSFLKKMAKRIRKYNGSLNVITQNPVDFLDPAIKREGSVVLSNSSTKFLLRQEAEDLAIVAKLFNLSESEQDRLSTARQGEGLLISGNSRAWVTVNTAPHETALMYG